MERKRDEIIYTYNGIKGDDKLIKELNVIEFFNSAPKGKAAKYF